MKIFSIICCLSFLVSGHAQKVSPNRLPVFNSAQGPVILFGGSTMNSDGIDNKGTRFALSRAEENGAREAQLPLVGKVKTLRDFQKIVGAGFARQLQGQLKLKSDEALWSFIGQHRDLSAYGFAAFSVPFRVAMGAAYVDGEVKSQKSHSYVYTITVSAAGIAPGKISSVITIGASPDFLPPQLVQSRVKDSVVTLTWKVLTRRDRPYLASIYRQSGGVGSFALLPAKILTKSKGDSAIFVFTDKVNENSSYRYFIRPADLLNNAGIATSDTAAIVAANFARLPILQQVRAVDSLNGIFVSWKPLGVNPLITGIEIQRSRDSRGDYVIIDTVSALAHTYQDRRLLPHIAYYYRLCVLHAGKQEQKEKFYATVSGVLQKSGVVPDAPYGLTVSTVSNGLHIAWQPVSDPDFSAYFVYRGSSLNSKMVVISPAITDTAFTDTASNLSRETNYVYAVKAVSTGAVESVFSRKVAARLPRGKERPLTPGGIRLNPGPDLLHIEWEDTRRSDAGVLGYILYKHLKGSQPLQYDAVKPASVEAARLNLTPVLNGIISVPFFDDLPARDGRRYEYLVSAVDRFGMESGLSPCAATPALVPGLRPPDKVYVRSVPAGIALQWQQADSTGIRGFIIYRRVIPEQKPVRIGQVSNVTTAFIDAQTSHGNLYAYTIKAIVATGETAPTDEYTMRK